MSFYRVIFISREKISMAHNRLNIAFSNLYTYSFGMVGGEGVEEISTDFL